MQRFEGELAIDVRWKSMSNGFDVHLAALDFHRTSIAVHLQIVAQLMFAVCAWTQIPVCVRLKIICAREQRKKQLDWLVTNTDDITSRSHSLFACSRE